MNANVVSDFSPPESDERRCTFLSRGLTANVIPPANGSSSFSRTRFPLPLVRRAKISDQELAPLVRDADQLLVGLNETRRQFNQYVRTVVGRGGGHPVVGDKLVCLRNNPRDGLLNGQIWTVQGVSGTEYLRLRLRGEEGETLSCMAHPEHFVGNHDHIDPRTRMNANEFDFGYALTVHKSQGSSWDNVILLDEWRSSNRKQWLYTGITRAAKRITIVQ